ncbi:MAG: glycosyltransferase family 4 protein [Chlorobi bacterium]|nr:glycosyltransferase family 4 protein [Chlorobiota bacterium]MCI0714812.1 glycosyltransferase family 4 protein [Chlorobiota bacterium]
MKKFKILFIKKYDANPKFILNDIEILKGKFDVKVNNVKTKNSIFIIITLIKEFFYLLFNTWRFRIIFIWFADYHSFLPVSFAKIFGKKCVICAGGYECTYIPEINMGVFTGETFSKKVRSFCASYSLRNCGIILPVDESLIENVNTYIYSDLPNKTPLKDGMKKFLPALKTKIETIYLGYDSEAFRKINNNPKEYSVLSAGLIINDDEYKRKGFDLLIESAKYMKDVKFVLIGLNDEYAEKLSKLELRNVRLLKILNYEKLIEEYSKAKVFAQISMFEGLPSTICEAMLCECIPVGSNVNGIPKIIDEYGFLINKRNVKDVIETLYKALNSPEELGLKARNHIINNFSLQNRKARLLNVLNNLLKIS